MHSTEEKGNNHWISRTAITLLRGFVRGYQLLIAPLLGHNCRFLPGCSSYAMEALEVHGPLNGSWLAAKRICRCHPWGGEGFDPVPGSDVPGIQKSTSSNLTPSMPETVRIPSKG